jgi:2-(1,2-epoxy-1,2-dihydrophenyl)acetyl-CoA isomerase
MMFHIVEFRKLLKILCFRMPNEYMEKESVMEKIVFSHEDHVAIISMNRSESYNALDMEFAAKFADALDRCATDPGIRAIVVTGNGKAFCAGGDLRDVALGSDEYASHEPKAAAERMRELATGLNRLILGIRRSDKPVIAAINGVAAGAGFSIAMACDLRIAAESAKFKQAYTSGGMTPDGGWTLFVPMQVGYARTMELLLLDEGISAQKALALGIVNEICPGEELLSRALEWGHKIASGSAHAFAASKKLIGKTCFPDLEAALDRECRSITEAVLGTDGQEGIASFLEKRPPNFHTGDAVLSEMQQQ